MVYRDDSITTFEYSEETLRSLYSMFCYGYRHGGPQAEALWYFDTRISYQELMDSVHAFAAGLVQEGVKKGDYVTIFLPNIPQCVIAVYAVNRLGAVCNLVHPLSTRQELEYCVKLTDSRLILAFDQNAKLCEGLGAEIICCDTTTYFPKSPKGFVLRYGYKFLNRKIAKSAEAKAWTAVFAAGKQYLKEGGSLPEDTMTAEDTAAVMYTGGTTGDPKGVVLSNAAVNASTSEMILEKLDNAPHIGYAFLSVLPVFHAFGLSIVIHAPLSGGMRCILMPNFDTKKCANTILQEKIEIIAGVPAMFERMYPLLKDADLSFIKHMVSGGDKVSPEMVARYNAIMNTQFLPGYGLTEACGACLLTKLGYDEFPEGCVGRPLRKNTLCLVEPGTTKVVTEAGEGELCIRGPMLMDGYYKNPEATADVMRLHDDGLVWLHTGDVVTLDEEQNVIFKSRYKRMLKVNGYNVYPTIIENVMEKCPAIAEVCAVGMPWKNGDTRVKLFVTLADKNADEAAAVAEIKEYALAQMNRWHQPKVIRVIEKLPMTKMNKVDYKLLETLE